MMHDVGFDLARQQGVGRLRDVVFISQGWMTESPADEQPTGRPSEDPQRREVLLVGGHNMKTDERDLTIFPLVRDAQGTVQRLDTYTPPEEAPTRSPLLDAFVAGYHEGRRSRS